MNWHQFLGKAEITLNMRKQDPRFAAPNLEEQEPEVANGQAEVAKLI